MKVEHLHVQIEEKNIIEDMTYDVNKGELLVIMGRNGCGKSTMAQAIAGHPAYKSSGKVIIDNDNLLDVSPDERSKRGLFLSFQYPVEIEGVPVDQFIRMAINAHREKPIRISEFKKSLHEKMIGLNINPDFSKRYLNKGFSGGEKKKMEILQLAMLNPKVAILDETDSGLDIDALKEVCAGIQKVRVENPDMSIILITHYKRILEYLAPDRVMIMSKGKIVKIGGRDLVQDIEKKGYEQFERR